MNSEASRLPSLFANRWLRRLAWTVALVLLIWLLAWAIVPPVLKHQLVKVADAELGRSLTVGEIDFKPWTLELTVRDLALATQDGASTQLEVKRIYVDAELESLVRLGPVVQALEVDSPVVRLRRTGDGRYDIDDMLDRFAAVPATPEADAAPLRFALFNLAIRDGSAELDDRPIDRIHVVRGLNLSLPFFSNLASRRDVTVTPALAFTLNGARFDSQAASTPFATVHKTDAQLRVQAMDLQPYLPYVPRSIPVQLRQAVLDADMQLQFVQTEQDQPQLVVRGRMQLTAVEMVDGSGDGLLALDSVAVTVDELRPLERIVRMGTIELQAPRLQARRDAAGRINLALAGAGGEAAAAAPVPADPPAAEAGWTASLARLQLRDGAVDWHDAAVTPAARLQVRGLTLDVDDLVWPMAHAAALKGALTLAATPAEGAAAPRQSQTADDKPAEARLAFEGSGTDREATVKLRLSDAPLALAESYVAQFLEPGLRGQLGADLTLRWRDPGLQLDIASVTLDRLALVARAGTETSGLPQVRRIAVADAAIDMDKRLVTIARLEIAQPELAVTRGADARWMVEHWLKGAAANDPAAAQPTRAGTDSNPPAWQVRLDQLQLVDGALRFDDRLQPRPVQLAVSGVQLDMRNITSDGQQPVTTRLSARVAAGQGPAGTVDYRGTLQRTPLQTKGKLLMTQLPLHALEPYFGAGLNIEILRADAGFKGDVDFAAMDSGPRLRLQGDVVLEDFRANSLAGAGATPALAQELLNWKALGVRGVDLALAPGQPLRLSVRETTLSDFFARVIVHETGRINLQDLLRSDGAPPTDSGAAAATTVAAPPPAPAAPAASAPAPAPAVVAAAAAADPLAPQIRIGPISLVQGKVFFSDRFVKPNYSANLSELTGRLSAFSSASVQQPGQGSMADLELRGRAETTASLEILGKLNPLADPLALDIKGVVRDLELPPLSPYAIKYAGHGIERGKLSVDVAYQVLPNGQLTASNKVVLNQLAFGDKVDGAPNSLPVKLAVALLADSNGVIDIDLPVSGSLNDPQFRLGPVIFKVIVNLIGKALTAPFSLLASALGGGGDELSQVAFAPGSARLQAQARGSLDKVAKALSDRPALKMTVVGTASLEAEREAYQRARLQILLQAEKRRAQVAAGQTPQVSDDRPADAPPDQARTAETAVLLKQLFARSEIARPRDLSGKPRELTTADMETLLLTNIPVDEESMRELALQRGVAVKDYLASRALPADRLFLGAAKLAEADEKWSPKAELSLGTK